MVDTKAFDVIRARLHIKEIAPTEGFSSILSGFLSLFQVRVIF